MTDRRPLVLLEDVAKEFGISRFTIHRLARRLDLMPHYLPQPGTPPKRCFTIQDRKILKNGLENRPHILKMGK